MTKGELTGEHDLLLRAAVDWQATVDRCTVRANLTLVLIASTAVTAVSGWILCLIQSPSLASIIAGVITGISAITLVKATALRGRLNGRADYARASIYVVANLVKRLVEVGSDYDLQTWQSIIAGQRNAPLVVPDHRARPG